MWERLKKPAGRDCDDAGCASGKRNRYYRGKHLKAEEFKAEQAYFIGRRTLLNRAVTGFGVVRGFRVEPFEEGSPFRLVAGAGLALDAGGRELVLVDGATLSPDNVFLLAKTSTGLEATSVEGVGAGRYALAAHYAERGVGALDPSGGCGCKRMERAYLCETVVFSLRLLDAENPKDPEGSPPKPCPCGAPLCPDREGCVDHDGCCGEGRGPQGRLCAWTADPPDFSPSRLCEWNEHQVAVGDGVDLACVTVSAVEGECPQLVFESVDDSCGPRRIVKSNDLLFDLIRGCDLTRISEISWPYRRGADDPLPWPEFLRFFVADETDGPPPAGEDGAPPPRAATAFHVAFDGPVKTGSLGPDVVSITVLTVDQDTSWLVAQRVPILAVVPDASKDDYTLGFGITVDADWIYDELRGNSSRLSQTAFTVEVEVFGDRIEDCNGQTVDANARGLTGAPSGNGSPGGTHRSSFVVEAKPSKPSRTRTRVKENVDDIP